MGSKLQNDEAINTFWNALIVTWNLLQDPLSQYAVYKDYLATNDHDASYWLNIPYTWFKTKMLVSNNFVLCYVCMNTDKHGGRGFRVIIFTGSTSFSLLYIVMELAYSWDDSIAHIFSFCLWLSIIICSEFYWNFGMNAYKLFLFPVLRVPWSVHAVCGINSPGRKNCI